MTIEVFAPAKINLTLHVTGQRADGYHLLDSLVVFADIGDRLWLTPDTNMQISVEGPFAHGVPTDNRNLVWRAAELAGWSGHIRLQKNLPHGAGIGGGSSDAAAVLSALGYQGDASSLGADVPVCRHASAARMQGIGDVLTPLSAIPELTALLVNPGVHVATPETFHRLHSKTNPSMEKLPAFGASRADWLAWLTAHRNDLEIPALGHARSIETALDLLRTTPRSELVRMSGSGSTCFAIYPTRHDAEKAASIIAGTQPDWWTCVTTLT